METNNITNQIVQSIKKDHADAEVILFGSKARNDAKEDSDWDILILLNQQIVNLEDELKIRNNLFDIELATGANISTFAYSKTDWHNRLKIIPLYKNVIREGIIL